MTTLMAFIAGASMIGSFWAAHYAETSTCEEEPEQVAANHEWLQGNIDDLKIF